MLNSRFFLFPFSLVVSLLVFLGSYSESIAKIKGSYVVYNNNMSGPGSLLQALTDANNSGVASDIYFQSNCTVVTASLPTCQVNLNLWAGSSYTIDGQNSTGPFLQTDNNVNITIDKLKLSLINFAQTNYVITNNNSDNVAGSFKKIISYAEQTPVEDIISFNISGVSPHTIDLSTYSQFLYYPLTIDGSTQPNNGYTGTLPKIIIDGGDLYYNAKTTIAGLHFKRHGLSIRSATNNNSIIGKNTAPILFAENVNMHVEDCQNLTITNTYFGLDWEGNTYISTNDLSLYIDRTTGTTIENCHVASAYFFRPQFDLNTTINNCTFGYKLNKNELSNSLPSVILDHSDYLSFTNNSLISISLDVCSNSTLKNNKFGVDLTNNPLRRSSVDINQCSNITFGGNSLTGEGNVIYGGMYLFNSTDILITGNEIFSGIQSGYIPLIYNNPFIGILCHYNSARITIGQSNNGFANIIRETDVAVFNDRSNNVAVRWNKMYDNTTSAMINNDDQSAISNNGIQPPVITSIQNSQDIYGTAVTGDAVDIYLKKDGNTIEQGYTFLGTSIADIDGNWIFSNSTQFTDKCNIVLSTTSPLNNTSEFIGTYPICSYIESVNSTNDGTAKQVIYPNPSSLNKLNVKLNSETTAQVTITNVLGEKIEEFEINSLTEFEINTTSYKKGSYLLKVNSESKTETTSFIIQ